MQNMGAGFALPGLLLVLALMTVGFVFLGHFGATKGSGRWWGWLVAGPSVLLGLVFGWSALGNLVANIAKPSPELRDPMFWLLIFGLLVPFLGAVYVVLLGLKYRRHGKRKDVA